jgi:nucleoside-diphosphate-sugar epimerase
VSDISKLDLQGRTVLVTGGGGMLGSQLTKLLVAHDATVRVFDNSSAYPFPYLERYLCNLDVEVIDGDVRDSSALGNALRGIELVVHAAAYADVAACIANYDEDFSTNVHGTFNVLDQCTRAGVERLVFISSASVYGEREGEAAASCFAEDDAPMPLSTYAHSKLWGEVQGRLMHCLHGLSVLSLRLFSVYGPPQVPKEGSHSWCVACFVMRGLRGKPLIVNGDGGQVRDFVHVTDIARAVASALVAGSADGRVLNVGTGRPTRVVEVAQMVAELLGGLEIQFGPQRRGDPHGGYADLGRTRADLGWVARMPLRQGIADYVEWAKANSDLVPTWL